MRHDVVYTFVFAAVVCVVCGVLVSTSAVSLADLRERNAKLDKMKNVLTVSGLAKTGERLSAAEIEKRFQKSVRPLPIDLKTGEKTDAIDPDTYDERAAQADPAKSYPAPANLSAIKRIPKYLVVYEILDEAGKPKLVVLPIQGYGLWSTLYGFLAMDVDLETIEGLSYYEQGETAGLGGEVDNPRWKARWPGRRAFDKNGKVAIHVIKGPAGPPASDPFEVDGLSGATLTSNGVTHMLRFWLSKHGYGPFFRWYGAAEHSKG